MGKLTIEHLAPYLHLRINPLKFQTDNGIWTLDGLSGAWNVHGRKGMFVDDKIHVETVKPYLRPLSDLTKEIEVNGERFVPLVKILNLGFGDNFKFIDNVKMNGVNVEAETDHGDFGTQYHDFGFFSYKTASSLPYYHIKKLHEWHFDTADLIGQGLALSIHDLT